MRIFTLALIIAMAFGLSIPAQAGDASGAISAGFQRDLQRSPAPLYPVHRKPDPVIRMINTALRADSGSLAASFARDLQRQPSVTYAFRNETDPVQSLVNNTLLGNLNPLAIMLDRTYVASRRADTEAGAVD